MSKIEQLIKKFCPKEVEHVPLSQSVAIKRGVRVVKQQLKEEGQYPVFQNCLTSMGFYDQTNCPAGTAFVIAAGAAGSVGYSDVDFWAADDCYYMVPPEGVNGKYLYYALKSKEHQLLAKVRKASVPRLAREVVESVEIAFPPRPVQDEIVKALDAMDAVVKALEEERNARQAQFEAMRDKLLKFANGGGYNVVFLRELVREGLIKMTRGNVISKKDIAACPGDYPIYSSSAMGDGEFGRYGKFMFEEELVTWSIDGGGRFFYRPKKRFSVTNVCGYMRINDLKVLNTKYLYYILSQQWLSKKYDYTHKALPTNIVNDYLIPMRPIADQEKIVTRLDKFEDVLTALDEEIAARREQFAGWLEKLMEFKEAA